MFFNNLTNKIEEIDQRSQTFSKVLPLTYRIKPGTTAKSTFNEWLRFKGDFVEILGNGIFT